MDDKTMRRWRRLSQEDIEQAVNGKDPEPIWDLATWVNGEWWPVKQPVSLALGITHRDLNSRQAWRKLRRLGLPVHDKNLDGPLPVSPSSSRTANDHEIRKLALALSAEVNRGKAVPPEAVIGMADAFVSWLEPAKRSS